MKVLKYLIVFIHFLRSAWHWEIKRVAVKGEGSQRGIWLAGALRHGKRYASSLRSFSVPKVRWVINQLTIHTHNGGASQWSADSQPFYVPFSYSARVHTKRADALLKMCFWLYVHTDITQNLLSFVRANEYTITVNPTHNIPSVIISSKNKTIKHTRLRNPLDSHRPKLNVNRCEPSVLQWTVTPQKCEEEEEKIQKLFFCIWRSLTFSTE